MSTPGTARSSGFQGGEDWSDRSDHERDEQGGNPVSVGLSGKRTRGDAPGSMPNAANRLRSKGMPGVKEEETLAQAPGSETRNTGNICVPEMPFLEKAGTPARTSCSRKRFSGKGEVAPKFRRRSPAAYGPDEAGALGRKTRRTKRKGFVRGKKKGGNPGIRVASAFNQSSSVGRMVSTGQVAFFTTFSATEPNRMRSMPLRPRVPMTMMSACSLSARARISSAA